MKKFTQSVLGIAIVFAMLLFSNGTIAQNANDYQIDDGGSVIFNAGTYTGAVTSTTGSSSSTAQLQTNGIVTLSGVYSGFYGLLKLQDAGSASLNAGTFASKFEVGGSSNTGATKLSVDYASGVTLTSSATNVITMDKYGVLDMIKGLSAGTNILLNSYNNANAPLIKFYISGSTPKIDITGTGKTLLTDDGTNGQINASKHLAFDISNAPVSATGVQHFIIASFIDTDPFVTGTPSTNVTGDPDGVWGSYSVDVNSHDLRFNASYSPPFQLDNAAYANNWTAMNTGASSSGTELLLKNYALTTSQSSTKSFTIDLSSYNLSGSNTISVSAGKILGFKSSGGNLDNSIAFGDMTSALQLIGSVSGYLGSNFAISASSTSTGALILGDGTVASTLTLDGALNTKFNSKVSKVVVSANATLTVTP